MCQFETDQLHVFKFSDLTRNIFLTGQVVGINIVHGQVYNNSKNRQKLCKIMILYRIVPMSVMAETCG